MDSSLTVRKVENAADHKVMVEFPWTLYKNDPNWVPSLVSTRRRLFDKTRNPSWEYLRGDYFVAWRDGQPVGTIAAFVNPRHNEVWDEHTGFFGAFECIEDQAVATALLNTAADHLRGMGGLTHMRGPATFTCNDEGWGILVENFSTPVLLMPYNPPHYERLLLNSGVGLAQVMDFLSYYCDPDIILSDGGEINRKFVRVVNKVMERYQITIRNPDPKNLKEELRLLRQVYEAAWQKNWGNVPPSDHEIDHLFEDLKDFFDPELALFVYVRGQLAGFFLGLPDMNQVLKRAYPSPRTPEVITLLKALWHWKIRPKITWQRCLLFGVKPEFRRMGVDAVCFLKYFEQTLKGRFPHIDAGWVLEPNRDVRQLAEEAGARLYKRYRMFQSPL